MERNDQTNNKYQDHSEALAADHLQTQNCVMLIDYDTQTVTVINTRTHHETHHDIADTPRIGIQQTLQLLVAHKYDYAKKKNGIYI